MTRAKRSTAAKTSTESTIYVGPSLPGGKLGRYTVFRDGEMMPHVQALVDECPSMKSLIVPVSKLSAIELKLADPSSVEAARFTEIRKHFIKGVK